MKENEKKLVIGAGIVGAGLLAFGLYERFKKTEPGPPGTITYSNLLIDPTTVAPGQMVSISVLVTNHSLTPIFTAVILTGDVSDSQHINIPADSSQIVTFTTTPITEGTYHVSVGGLSASFLCTGDPQGEISYSDLVFSVPSCTVGETVEVSVTATNSGTASQVIMVAIGMSGDVYNDSWQYTRQVSIQPGESKVISFTFQPTVAETYTATIAGLSATLTVENGPGWPGWTPLTVVYEITPDPEVLYLGQSVQIGVYIQGPPGPENYPMDLQATIDVDGTTLSRVFHIEFRNPTLLFTYTPTRLGEHIITAQDKTASFTVLANPVGTYYSPFGDPRVPECTDIVLPDVAPFTIDNFLWADGHWGTFEWPGGDLKYSDMMNAVSQSYWPTRDPRNRFIIWSPFRIPQVLEKLPQAEPIAWYPADSQVTEYTLEVDLTYSWGPLVTIAATVYTCQQYYETKDELARENIVDHISSQCFNSGQCRYTIICPYGNDFPTTAWVYTFDKLSFARSFLEHIESEHPDHPLTEPP